MVKHNSSISDEKHLVVRRGRVDSVDLYEVKENELELLEKGSPATLQLNFAIFLFSIALTCVVALATTTFKWPIVQSIFTFASVIGVLMGSYLIISWWRTRTSIAEVISRIKKRINEEPLSALEPSSESGNVPANNEAPHG
ncbi:MAG: hypothetical protein ABW168_09195 [Sedimenticola sp.]